MPYYCQQCGTNLDVESGFSPSKREECPKCGADLHCCLNCKYHEEHSYNQCREPQAERVLNKAGYNFCDYFEFKSSSDSPKSSAKKNDYIKELDNLFK